jgi:diguanylate cyclase (GGDEF)-like protein
VAGPSSSDRPAESTNGAVNGQKKTADPVATPSDEQTLADGDQTLSDSDQTLSDSDQTSSDNDQISADSDQFAADRDQAASDRDLDAGATARAHEFSRDIRERTARQREQTAGARLDTASKRDETAHVRDVAAQVRDQAAQARDIAMTQHDLALEQDAAGGELAERAAERRNRAAQHRVEAAEYRALAIEDREAAARDREQAAADRQRALSDREALSRQLAIADTDPLTGVRTRAAGLIELDHEFDRCRRTDGQLVVAYVDVVGLKRVNDSVGHAAGDAMLVRIVEAIKSHLRSYDLIIRLGGDEFLCVVSNMSVPDARERFDAIGAALADAPDGGQIRAGFGGLKPEDTVMDLIARADHDLLDSRAR